MPEAKRGYIPTSDDERAEMLRKIGVMEVDDLFRDIPPDFLNPELNLPPGRSSLELMRHMSSLAEKNRHMDGGLGGMPSFLGNGVYRSFIPKAVDDIASRSEFYTAYTPYQPTISQGTLQATFELQSMLCEIMGTEISNAGIFNGPTAAGEGGVMSVRIQEYIKRQENRREIAVPPNVRNNIREVISAYASGRGSVVRVIERGGPAIIGENTACVFVQQPNAFGYLEDLEEWEQIAHKAGALFGVYADPIYAASFDESPGSFRADIVVGDAQVLGNPPNFGGPSFGILTTRLDFVRQMPGRLIGRTIDKNGNIAYVITLPGREQFERRANRPTSNITTSAALVGLRSAIYIALMGWQGLRNVGEQSFHKAHYLADRISSLKGFRLPLEGDFFREFVVECPIPPAEVNRRLLQAGILGGVDVTDRIPRGLLLCCTEMNSRGEIDQLVEELAKIGAKGV